MMNPSNPVFNEAEWAKIHAMSSERMTLEGTATKSLILLGIITVTAMATGMMTIQTPGMGFIIMIGGLIGGLITALVLIWGNQERAPMLAPVYAVFEGMLLGPITIMYESYYEGIAMNAVSLTLAVAIAMGFLYTSRIIKLTEGMKIALTSAIMGIFLVYIVNMIMMLFGSNIAILHSSGPLGIGLSLLIIAVASFSLLMDYEFIENGVKNGAPKHMEWYAAFGLIVTLIWLYLEMLRLLAKLRR